MNAAEERLAKASREALARRLRVKTGLGAVKARLTPSRLVADGKRHVRDQAKAVATESKAHVRAHPVLTAAVVGGLAAWVFRKPLLRFAPPLARRGYDWLAGKLPFSEIVADAESQDADWPELDGELERPFGPEGNSDEDPDAAVNVGQDVENNAER